MDIMLIYYVNIHLCNGFDSSYRILNGQMRLERMVVMKKSRIMLSVILSVCLFAGTFFSIRANADDAVVTGTVAVGSDASLLKFDTSSGQMLIKLDENTSYAEAKNLLPGRELTITLKYGADAYMHAVAIKDGVNNSSVTIDRANPSTVSGTIKDCKTTDILYLQTQQGDMEIKLDSTTDYTGCTTMVAGSYYSVEVARGNDAYMHALSIKDATRPTTSYASTSYTTSNTASSAGTYSSTTNTNDASSTITLPSGATVSGASTTVSGTVGSKTDSSVLYLDTSSGQMQIKLDCVSGVCVLVSGQKVTVKVGYGTDEYWHARTVS